MNCLSFKTKFGWMSAFEEKNKVVEVKFQKYKNNNITKNLKKIRNNICNYFSKKKEIIHGDFLMKGNKVQRKVWNELKKIQLGKTKSYGEIAKKLNMSPRHVGKICGQNKILLIIPCHRVIRSDGTVGGFSSIGGVNLKKKLLEFENLWKQ